MVYIPPKDDVDYHWDMEARCKGVDTEIFFPPRDKDRYKVIADEAKTYCFGENGKNPCKVRNECLWDAIRRDEPHGIWGGLSHRERNAVVRRYKKQYSDTMTLEEYVKSL